MKFCLVTDYSEVVSLEMEKQLHEWIKCNKNGNTQKTEIFLWKFTIVECLTIEDTIVKQITLKSTIKNFRNIREELDKVGKRFQFYILIFLTELYPAE